MHSCWSENLQQNHKWVWWESALVRMHQNIENCPSTLVTATLTILYGHIAVSIVLSTVLNYEWNFVYFFFEFVLKKMLFFFLYCQQLWADCLCGFVHILLIAIMFSSDATVGVTCRINRQIVDYRLLTNLTLSHP